MVAGFWLNQDGLPLQFGTQKAIPEVGGDYLVYGETREIEQLIPLVPMSSGTGTSILIPAPPTTFSGTGTPIQAGIQSMTDLVPLQLTAPQVTTTGGNLIITNTQLFFESVEVETIIGATGGTSLAVGLVAINPASPQQYAQVTPNAGAQLLNGLVIARITTAGQRTTFTQPGTTGLEWDTGGTQAAGGGSWLGNVPLVTNSFTTPGGQTQLPSKAYISTIATGAFTNGLIKLRLRYTLWGNISQ
jgi:hypothetical protein